MNALQIIGLLNGLAQTAKAAGPLIAQAMAALSSEDKAQVETALAQFQYANDQLHTATQAKLRG